MQSALTSLWRLYSSRANSDPFQKFRVLAKLQLLKSKRSQKVDPTATPGH